MFSIPSVFLSWLNNVWLVNKDWFLSKVENVSSIIQYIIPQDLDGIRFEVTITADIHVYWWQWGYTKNTCHHYQEIQVFKQQYFNPVPQPKPVVMCITSNWKVKGKQENLWRAFCDNHILRRGNNDIVFIEVLSNSSWNPRVSLPILHLYPEKLVQQYCCPRSIHQLFPLPEDARLHSM